MNPHAVLGPVLLEAEEGHHALGTGLPRASSHAAHARRLLGNGCPLQNPLLDGKKATPEGWWAGTGTGVEQEGGTAVPRQSQESCEPQQRCCTEQSVSGSAG